MGRGVDAFTLPVVTGSLLSYPLTIPVPPYPSHSSSSSSSRSRSRSHSPSPSPSPFVTLSIPPVSHYSITMPLIPNVITRAVAWAAETFYHLDVRGGTVPSGPVLI